jgi:hypothetical protein
MEPKASGAGLLDYLIILRCSIKYYKYVQSSEFEWEDFKRSFGGTRKGEVIYLEEDRKNTKHFGRLAGSLLGHERDTFERKSNALPLR